MMHLCMALALMCGDRPMPSAFDARNIVFVGGARPKAELSGDKAIAFSAAGQPRFTGTADFLFLIAKNPTHRIEEWNPARELVRISRDASTEIWLHCSQLKAMEIACSKLRARPTADGRIELGAQLKVRAAASRSGSQLNARGMPSCPGDPRCPRP